MKSFLILRSIKFIDMLCIREYYLQVLVSGAADEATDWLAAPQSASQLETVDAAISIDSAL